MPWNFANLEWLLDIVFTALSGARPMGFESLEKVTSQLQTKQVTRSLRTEAAQLERVRVDTPKPIAQVMKPRRSAKRSLVGLTVPQMLELLQKCDEDKREQLLETLNLPDASPVKMALRFRLEASPSAPVTSKARIAPKARLLLPKASAVDPESARVRDLTQLPGIGPVRARKILAERERGGPFLSVTDLKQRVKGIGDATAKVIAPFIEVDNGSGAEQ